MKTAPSSGTRFPISTELTMHSIQSILKAGLVSLGLVLAGGSDTGAQTPNGAIYVHLNYDLNTISHYVDFSTTTGPNRQWGNWTLPPYVNNRREGFRTPGPVKYMDMWIKANNYLNSCWDINYATVPGIGTVDLTIFAGLYALPNEPTNPPPWRPYWQLVGDDADASTYLPRARIWFKGNHKNYQSLRLTGYRDDGYYNDGAVWSRISRVITTSQTTCQNPGNAAALTVGSEAVNVARFGQ